MPTSKIYYQALQAAFKTHDFRESTKSLREKRDPIFKGK